MILDTMTRDVKYALRGLARTPGYAAIFVVTLGLGIGANTAMFSAVSGVLIRPLPHEDGDRLVYLRHTARQADVENARFSVPEVEDYRRGSHSLQSVAEFSSLTFTMLGLDTPLRVRAGIVTGNYFDVMGLSATLGRTVGREDDGADAPPVVVLSDAYWRSVFGADPEIIGKTVLMNGLTATFVGVAEPAPPYPERTDIYVNMAASPHHLSASMSDDRSHRMTEVFARLAPGATVESVLAETSVITSQLHAEYPEAYDAASGFEVTVTPLKTQLTARARPMLLILLGTAFLVLIIACANLANLTWTRVLGRGQELAIRTSLGASRTALRRALLVECLILAGAGAVLGLFLAAASLELLVGFAARFTSRASEIILDSSVFGFALLVAVAASVFFTMLPPLPDGSRVGSSSARTIGSRTKRAQRALVVAQIATSFVLLIGAGLLVKTMVQLSRVDPGFDTASILTLDIPKPWEVLRQDSTRSQYLAILDGVRALPGVASAALTSSIPLSGYRFRIPVDVEGHEPVPGAPSVTAEFRVVSPEFFSTMGIDLLRGRDFTATDVEDARKVVVINESMARAYFGERDPIGQRIAWTHENLAKFGGVGPEWRTVVGVVTDTRGYGLDADVAHTVYNPYPQVRTMMGSLVLRVKGYPEAAVSAVREVVAAYDANQPIVNVATMEDVRRESVAPRRLNTMLLGGFALLALVIASVGIGGVLAFSVRSRTREFGVRSALGAARHQIGSGVLAEGAALTAVGISMGSVAAVVLTRFIAGQLYGVPTLDPVTFAVVGLLLAAVAIIAAGKPAWRAASVSPMEAMRAD